MNIKNSLSLLTALTLSVTLFLSASTNAYALAELQGGDFAQAFNNTTQAGTWRDPVDASAGQIVEFRVTAKNVGDEVATNVQVVGSVTGMLPPGLSKQLILTSRIASSSYGTQVLTDTATINVTSPLDEGLRYVPGHSRIQGVTNLYNCPTACDLPDGHVLGGFEVGDIQPGQFVEVTFKGTLTINVASPAPSVAPSTPPASSTPAVNIVNTNTNTNTVNVNQPTPTPAPKTLPKTGLPLAGALAFGAFPAGALLKRFNKNVDSDADSIWKDRQFKI